MKKFLFAFFLTVFTICFTPSITIAQKSKSYKPKTVRVKSYTTKKGKSVRSYYRSKPSRGKSSGIFMFKNPMIANTGFSTPNKESFVYS